NGKTRHSLYVSPGVCVGRSRTPVDGLAISVDLSGLRETRGRRVDGILGMEFLRNYVLQVEFDAERVRLLKTSTGAAGKKIQLDMDSTGRPVVNVEIPGVGSTPFLIDTGRAGFSNGDLAPKTFESLLRQKQITGVEPCTFVTFEGFVDSRTGVLSQ